MLVKVLGEGEEDDVCPVNVRTIQGVELDRLKFQYYDGAKNDPLYVVE